MVGDAEKLRYVEACDALASLGESGRAVLAERMNVERFQAGEVIVSQGEEADRVFVFAEGRASVYLGGSETPHRRLGPGQIWGVYGLFSEWRRTGTVKADSDCLLLSLGYRRFRDFIDEFPEVTIHLLERAIARLVEYERKLYG